MNKPTEIAKQLKDAQVALSNALRLASQLCDYDERIIRKAAEGVTEVLGHLTADKTSPWWGYSQRAK